ncbi:MAG: hypothetical protein LBS18_08385 [Clostridiales bacterium]|jgi:hypothetical protein|nr:hypothetical protein [Clostridiales bacterium]
MSYIKEKVSYLKGLLDGLHIGDDPQSKLIAAMIEVMDNIADVIDDNEATIDELDECISDIYLTLDGMEEADAHDFPDEDTFVEVTCPHCHEVISFDEDMLAQNKDLICPACNKKVAFAE